MSTRDVLLGAAGRTLIDVDREEEAVNLLPPAPPARIAELERELGFGLPGELSELLRFSAGLEMLEDFDLASIGPCPWGAPLGPAAALPAQRLPRREHRALVLPRPGRLQA
jgi:hypothetical protein